jgi:carboxymethylenebutenolidase
MAIPESGCGPGLVILHSWWGLNPFFRTLCDRLAGIGFIALAPDLYDGRIATTAAAAKTLRAQALASRREPVYKFLMRTVASLSNHEAVTAPEIAVVGFSMGGHWALWLAQQPGLPISATVVFYAVRNGDFQRSHSRFLFHFAEKDEWVSDAGIRKLRKSLESAGRDATYYTYPGTAHWFFEADRPEAFHRKSAALAWERTVAFLKEYRDQPGRFITIPREVKIDKAIYRVDAMTKTYRYLRRNPEWRSLTAEENESNKKAIDGYTRILRGGRTKTFIRAEHP